ncbi:hypothetical protein [Aliarcobacter butzleri]|uniref:hypothetical protein n=1 Tax=Aliarcobacter butzleri TaxID=28197 RepID=UPI002B24F6C6|nr:hypothetical protein [Aliarcobacter butzleri]
MISWFRHKLGGISSIQTLIILIVFSSYVVLIIYCAFIHIGLALGAIFGSVILYFFASFIKWILNVVKTILGILFEAIIIKVYDEKNKVR